MSRIAVMQPYFFPYLGYFSLIKQVDQFILFDPVQFIRHGWIDRNRVLKQGEGWLYIRAPLVKHSHQAVIKDVEIDNGQPWQRKLLAQLAPYKRIAPYYRTVSALVETALAGEHSSIVDLNKATLEAVCRYLGIEKPLPIFSTMDLPIDTPSAADEWALNICKALGGVEEYWNPPGGQEFFDKSKYDSAGIKLKFHKPNLRVYDQKREPFEAGLSIIDVMMFNSPEEIGRMMDDYELI